MGKEEEAAAVMLCGSLTMLLEGEKRREGKGMRREGEGRWAHDSSGRGEKVREEEVVSRCLSRRGKKKGK
jgi:hypothetical protein